MSSDSKARVTPTPTPTTTMEDIWRQMRGLENALRHYSDIFAGWMEYGGKSYTDPVPGLDRLGPIPVPVCNPPWCYPTKTPNATAKDVQQIAALVKEAADAVEFVARGITLTKEDLYVSEMPGTCWPKQPEHGGH